MLLSLDQEIRRLAGGRCEYCRITEWQSPFPHILDHVIARQHGGKARFDNLALCCGKCNRFKGPNIAGIDPSTSELTRLFHPRRDVWQMHFEYQDTFLLGLTDVGRTTIAVLAINHSVRVATRAAMKRMGFF